MLEHRPPDPPRTEEELLARVRALAGKTLGDIARPLHLRVPRDLRRDKGFVGQTLETALGARAGSRPIPDFWHLGVELKTLPIGKDGRPRESTYVCAVPVDALHGLVWETSHVRRKLARVLFVPVEADPARPIADRRVGRATLWSCDDDPERDTLRADWEELASLIRQGFIDRITAHRGRVLQIRPKGADAHDARATVGEDGWLLATQPRGWYLRAAFTNRVLDRHYARPAATS
ncbi:MAG: DNA mismatch repair endonuclease MutH [Myxococcales bacterium]|nr:DNA mismatch repair endonuclease MutH [Myxococcales bacterium]MCB9731695.1 DNA mismatch repair endonuclease MutH [Deltaproteobacteria bacterium]